MADALPDADTVHALLDALAARLGLRLVIGRNGRAALTGPDGSRVKTWQENHPYPERLGKREYALVLRPLQIELLKLQRSVKSRGDRVLLIFEGRDAAGKGGAIRRFTEHLNPRGIRVVALDRPAEHERGENYLSRYLPHLPAPGEIALFDRSWYNRAGVEQVMGFCAPAEYDAFLREVPAFERRLAEDGITVVKFWFSVTRAEQLRRVADRHADPVKRWKLSAVDLASLGRWAEYTAAKEAMFARTDAPCARWVVVKGNDKRRARVEAMRYVLSLLGYDDKRPDVVGRPDPLIVGPVSDLPGLMAEEAPATPALAAQLPALPAATSPAAATARAAATW